MSEPRLATVDGQIIERCFPDPGPDATETQRKNLLFWRSKAMQACKDARADERRKVSDHIQAAVAAAIEGVKHAHAQALEQLGNAATERAKHISAASFYRGVGITGLFALILAASASFLTYQITMQTQVNTAAMARAVNAPRGLQNSPDMQPQEGAGFR